MEGNKDIGFYYLVKYFPYTQRGLEESLLFVSEKEAVKGFVFCDLLFKV